MLTICLTTIFISVSFALNAEESLIDYYVQLIEKETARAYKRTWPKDAYEHAPKSTKITDYGTFDHIIVGAGSSGAIIANRLSEDTFSNVLLLEAGGFTNNFTDIPGMALYLAGMEYNWGYLSIPQTTTFLSLKNNQCNLPRGKGLGGSSTINGLLYTRGNKKDYDNWYSQGNYGWAYKDVLPYFKKSENFHNGDGQYRGKGGYLNVEKLKTESPQTDAFFEANRFLGRNEVDYNAKEQLGFAYPQLNIRNGKRESTNNAFLLRVMERRNLRILTESYVIKILINKKKRAFGVLFTRNGEVFVAKSRRDIVISAGAIGSPQLLMLSGIGPRSHLRGLGIKVVQDLPVGELQDHPSFNLHVTINYTEPQLTLRQNVQNYLHGSGNLVNPYNTRALAFLQTKYAQISDSPDMEIIMMLSIDSNNITSQIWHLQEQILEQQDGADNTVTLIALLLHPKSRGYIRLKSANPFDFPIIDPNMLSDVNGEDIAVLYEGIQQILQIIDTPPFQKLNAKLNHIDLPECRIYEYYSREYWYCSIRHLSLPLFHLSSSCKMGTHPSRGAVVNPELKVFGISNLRVADSSIFPTSISGHTNAPAMMVGEKAADLIKFNY